jgi:peptide/nickel transport system substrate-binding protein
VIGAVVWRFLCRGALPRVGFGFVALGLSSCQLAHLGGAGATRSQVIFASPSDPATFNYALNQSLYSVFGYLYVGLLNSDGQSGDLLPGLAESWTIAPDNKTIRFTLRPNLKWSDGQPLTAADVVFSFRDVYLNPDVASGTRDILQVGEDQYPSVRAVNDRLVEFTVPRPFAPFLRNSGGLPILPKHALESSLKTKDKQGALKFLSTWGTDTDPRKIVVNGPYQMASYSPSERVIFEPNPHFWRAAEGLPNIKRIVVQTIESDANQLLRFRSKELDSLDIQPAVFRLVKAEEKKLGFKIFNGGAEAGSRSFGFNLSQAKDAKGVPFVDPIKARWFGNVKFRQAIAYAIDRPRMRNTIFQGLGEIQHSPIAASNPYYLSPEQGLKIYDYNPEKSREILKAEGFKVNGDGKLIDDRNNPVRFTLLVKTEEKFRVDMAVQIVRDLEAIGIQVDLQQVSFNVVLKQLKQRRWDTYVGGFGGGSVEPNSSANIWKSTGALHQFNQPPIPGEPPVLGWQASPWELEIDRLFQQGVQDIDEAKRKPIYHQFQRIAQEQLPFIPLVVPLNLTAVNQQIEGIKFGPIGGALWNLEELTVVK